MEENCGMMVEGEEVIVASLLQERLGRVAEALAVYAQEESHAFTQAVLMVKACFERGGKVILCGNGGSAAFCSHAVDDFFVDVFTDHPMPVIALVDNTPTVTAVANDLGYESVFSQQLRSLGNPGDVLIAVSTSGNSPNVLRASEVAKSRGMNVIGMTSFLGGELGAMADVWLRSTTPDGQVTEEMQLPLMHALAKSVAKLMFSRDG